MHDGDELTRRVREQGLSGARTVAVSDDPDTARRAIEELDLDRVLHCGATTHGWPYPAQAIRRYRDFLWVCWHRRDGSEPLAAISLLADQVWHCHMQEWERYVRDCERIFGPRRILNHTELAKDVDRYAHEEALRLYDLCNVPRPALDDRRAKCVWAVIRRP